MLHYPVWRRNIAARRHVAQLRINFLTSFPVTDSQGWTSCLTRKRLYDEKNKGMLIKIKACLKDKHNYLRVIYNRIIWKGLCWGISTIWVAGHSFVVSAQTLHYKGSNCAWAEKQYGTLIWSEIHLQHNAKKTKIRQSSYSTSTMDGAISIWFI